MNFKEIKNEVEKILVYRQQELLDLIPTWINRVQKEVCRLSNFSFLKTQENTTFYENINTYDLPALFKDDLKIWLELPTAYKPLQQITLTEALELFPPATPKAEPMYFRLADGNYVIYPTPEKDYNAIMEYYVYLPDLINDEDTNYITNNFPDVLINGAVYYGFMWLQEGDVTIWRMNYEEAVRKMISQDQARKFPPKSFMKYSLGAKKLPIKWRG